MLIKIEKKIAWVIEEVMVAKIIGIIHLALPFVAKYQPRPYEEPPTVPLNPLPQTEAPEKETEFI